MNPVDVKSRKYIEIGTENNENDSKFKVGDLLRICLYKNIFFKHYAPNW